MSNVISNSDEKKEVAKIIATKCLNDVKSNDYDILLNAYLDAYNYVKAKLDDEAKTYKEQKRGSINL